MTLELARDFAGYLPMGGLTEGWGVGTTGVGHTRIRPGMAYPPGRHPTDHALSWAGGRVLDASQVVYISEGRGRFESASGGKRRIEAGTVFLLFPGEWHRYEPMKRTGWVEDWVELRGPALAGLVESAVIAPSRPTYAVGVRPELLALYREAQRLARSTPAGYAPVLGVLGLQILSWVLFYAEAGEAEPSDADLGVRRARAIIEAEVERPLRMEEVAEQVGMSYSYFRRAFRVRTGVSPKQYHLQLRLRRVQALLAGTAMTITELADRTGFDSAFHLSAEFKRRTGMSPTQYRETIARRARSAGGRGN